MNTTFRTKTLAAISGASIALFLGLMTTTASAEDLHGSAKADFGANTLSIPCVHVTNSGGAADGQFFDVTLTRRGNSMNFELSTAEVEDAEFCQDVADYADSLDDDDVATPSVAVQCVSTAARTTVTVNGDALAAGSYSAKLTSGVNSATSTVKSAVNGDVTYSFDSDAAAVQQGAVQIPTTFVTGGTVKVDLVNDATVQTAATATATCTAS